MAFPTAPTVTKLEILTVLWLDFLHRKSKSKNKCSEYRYRIIYAPKQSLPVPAAARLLRLWVRIPPGAWTYASCDCRVLSGKGLCDGLITRSQDSYRLWCVVVWSKNLVNEEVLAHWGLSRRKQTNKQSLDFTGRCKWNSEFLWRALVAKWNEKCRKYWYLKCSITYSSLYLALHPYSRSSQAPSNNAWSCSIPML
jgi:hypothetical protein